MSPYNLQQIESAFATQRDQYASLDMAVRASNAARSPIVITKEDFSNKDHKIVYIDDEDTEEPSGDNPTGKERNFRPFHSLKKTQ